MSFQPCLIVPVYDPGPPLARTVASLAATGLPIYLVDDAPIAADHTLPDSASQEHLVVPPRSD